MSTSVLILGECIEKMSFIKDHSIDLVLTDPPYGTTACKWDVVIPLEPMWEVLLRIVKTNSAIIFTASQPFTSVLVVSQIAKFRHEWIYKKRCASNFAQAKYSPMKEHESVLVFSNTKANYYPIKEQRVGSGKQRAKYKYSDKSRHACGEFVNGICGEYNSQNDSGNDVLRYPSSVQEFNNRASGDRGLHPTQKPVELIEYLIKTYTKECETVLDFTMGSGTTGVAAANLNRNFIGIEKEIKYYNIAKERISNCNNVDIIEV